MSRSVAVVAASLVLAFSVNLAWAQGKVTITREESKPQKLEVKVGEEVRWGNGSAGTAHIMLAGEDAPKFYLGKEGRVKFDQPGTYEYTVHISGVKTHAHTGTVVV